MAVQSDYEFMSTTNNATINGLVGATLGFGDHKVGVMTMYVHDTDKETRSSEGYSLLTGDNVRDDTTHWIEREMINTQLTGEIGRAHVGTPVTTAPIVCRLLLV